MRLARIALISIFCLSLIPIAHARNTHGVRSVQEEFESWFADSLNAHVVSGCEPAIVTELTTSSFACQAYVIDGTRMRYIDQPAVTVTIADATPTWLAVHRSRTAAVAGWTRDRRPGSGYRPSLSGNY